MRRYVLALVCGLPLTAGCSTTRYYYEPAQQATGTILGSPAAHYLIPADTRLGDIRIASFGIDDLQLTEDSEEEPALHTRFIVANVRGARDWTMDTRTIRIQFSARGAPIAPTVVSSNGTGIPIVTIPRGESRTIDTYHILPRNFEGAEDIPQFDILWQMQTDTELVAERTPFDRHESAPPNNSVHYGPWGMGTYWGMGPSPWYDPWFNRPIMIHRVTPAPRVYYSPRR